MISKNSLSFLDEVGVKTSGALHNENKPLPARVMSSNLAQPGVLVQCVYEDDDPENVPRRYILAQRCISRQVGALPDEHLNMEAIVPTDEEITEAVSGIREKEPDLGQPKIRSLLRASRNWQISEARLKRLVPTARQAQEVQQAQHTAPKDALAVQQRYKDTQQARVFKVYGRGEHNYGVSLNAEQAIMMEICHNHLKEVGPPLDGLAARSLARSWHVRTIWNFYVAAATKAGVSKTDVGKQLEAEYGVPHQYLPTPATEKNGWEPEARKKVFEVNSLRIKKARLKTPAAKYVPVNEKGVPLWDETQDGEFAVTVVKIDKEDGLREFGEV